MEASLPSDIPFSSAQKRYYPFMYQQVDGHAEWKNEIKQWVKGATENKHENHEYSQNTEFEYLEKDSIHFFSPEGAIIHISS